MIAVSIDRSWPSPWPPTGPPCSSTRQCCCWAAMGSRSASPHSRACTGTALSWKPGIATVELADLAPDLVAAVGIRVLEGP